MVREYPAWELSVSSPPHLPFFLTPSRHKAWCEPYKTWQEAYTFDPLASIPASQQHLVLGGQGLLWTEQSGPENLDPIAWPRAAAIAEVFWTGEGRGSVETALPRLHDV